MDFSPFLQERGPAKKKTFRFARRDHSRNGPRNVGAPHKDSFQLFKINHRCFCCSTDQNRILSKAIPCTTVGLDCHEAFYANSSCPVACEGIYADVRRRWEYPGLKLIISTFHYHTHRDLLAQDKQKDWETLALLKSEYQLYKDQWGLNLRYSQEAGESENYSKILCNLLNINYSPSCQDTSGISSGAHFLW